MPRRRQAVLLAHNASVLCLFLCLRSAYGAWNSMPGAGAAAAATALLEDNYRVELGATIPSPLIDSHQESTTSVMVAEAWAHFDQHRARAEIMSIFRGQWANGMVPTVRYAPGYDGDFLGGSFLPGPGGWGSGDENASSAQSATGSNTSTLAAVPLHAEAALRIFDLSPRDAEARLWLQKLFPALFRYHDYLHGSRGDPETGLVYAHHPWESEVPADSPFFTGLLRETREQAANESWLPPPIPAAVASVPGFPGLEAFEAALFLSECSARLGRVDRDVEQECPFLLQDVQFNAALVRSDRALLELAGILEATRSSWQSKVYTPEQFQRLQEWAARAETGAAMKHLWSPAEGAFLSRYTSATTNTSFLVRPATSSDFSALLSPGLERFKADSVVDTLFSPGDVSFRCGNHPVVGLECGYDGNATARGGGGDGADGSVESVGIDGGVAAALGRKAMRNHDGYAAAEVGVEDHGSGGVIGFVGEEPPAAVAERGSRRVQVLHNFLAVRGFYRHRLEGIAAWLANSTLSLLAPAPPEFDSCGDGGDSVGGCGDADGDLFRFHRAFDADSGLPVPGSEGNASSVAAAAGVLLLLGDEPDGGNDFPPITHATLFVLVAIELAFSFAMGVSCLIFSLNLVRKLSEEDQPPYHRVSNGGGGGGGGGGGPFAGPTRTKTDEPAESGRQQQGRGDEHHEEDRGRWRSDLARGGRGIGSLLSRNAGSRLDTYDSDDEYVGVATAVAMTTNSGGGGETRRADAATWHEDSMTDDDGVSDDYGGGGSGSRISNRRHRAPGRGGGHAAESDLGGSGGSGGDDLGWEQYNRTGSSSGVEWGGARDVPRRRQGPSVTAAGAAGRRRIRRIGGADAAEEDDETPFTAIPGADGHGINRDGDGTGGGAGLFDFLRPFYAYFKFR